MLPFQMSHCGGDIYSNKMICMYSKAHCMSVESMTLSDTFGVNHCDGSIEKVLQWTSSTDFYDGTVQRYVFFMHYPPRDVNHSRRGPRTLHIQWENVGIKNTRKMGAKECNLDRYQDTFTDPFVKIPSIINFCILQHILCLPHQLFQYLLKYITASVERVCSPSANYFSEP